MNWNWDPHHWKKSTKVLLGAATIWPIVYMGLFFLTVFSFIFLIGFAENSSDNNSEDIDLIQLEKKINNGELEELRISGDEIVAVDRQRARQYRVFVRSDETRAEILRQARELNAKGEPRVAKIEEVASPRTPTAVPVGFGALFIAHIFTIFLIMGLMPLYIILAVKSDRLDQTMKIVWVVLICMMGMFAQPVYWYLYIWRDAPAGTMASTNNVGDKLSL